METHKKEIELLKRRGKKKDRNEKEEKCKERKKERKEQRPDWNERKRVYASKWTKKKKKDEKK